MVAKLNSSHLLAVAVPAIRHSRRLWLLALVAVASLLLLTGRGNSSSTSITATNSPITPALKLALGTLHLEGTDQAVDAAAAAQLLPLWQLMDELSTNSATSPAEITAVIEQIESSMTSSQLQSIQALNLTDSSVAKSSQAGGASATAGTTMASSNAKVSQAAGAIPGGYTGAAGMPLDGGGPMQAPSSQQDSSTSGSAGASGNTSLIKEVIQLLERKSQN